MTRRRRQRVSSCPPWICLTTMIRESRETRSTISVPRNRDGISPTMTLSALRQHSMSPFHTMEPTWTPFSNHRQVHRDKSRMNGLSTEGVRATTVRSLSRISTPLPSMTIVGALLSMPSLLPTAVFWHATHGRTRNLPRYHPLAEEVSNWTSSSFTPPSVGQIQTGLVILSLSRLKPLILRLHTVLVSGFQTSHVNLWTLHPL